MFTFLEINHTQKFLKTIKLIMVLLNRLLTKNVFVNKCRIPDWIIEGKITCIKYIYIKWIM